MIRGDVHEFLDQRTTGHEQAGRRFCVVVQGTHHLPSSTVVVAPTSLTAPHRSYRPRVRVLDRKTAVLVQHMKSVDISRLGRLVGHLSTEELWRIDDAIKDVLGLL